MYNIRKLYFINKKNNFTITYNKCLFLSKITRCKYF